MQELLHQQELQVLHLRLTDLPHGQGLLHLLRMLQELLVLLEIQELPVTQAILEPMVMAELLVQQETQEVMEILALMELQALRAQREL